MANWHLDELEKSLNAIGWEIVDRLEGNNYDISGSWNIQRKTKHRIDFNGLDDLITLPLEKSYGCYITEPSISLYFHKKGPTWKNALAEFIHKVNELD